MPTGFWRGVGPNNNVFAIECFMDELARKAGKDPVDFRRDMLGKTAALARRARSRGGESPAGASRCRRASGAAFACSRRSPASSRPSSRRKSTNMARCMLRRVTSRGRYRHRRQSRYRRGAARRRADLRPDRRALWRNHHRQRPGAAVQLQRLPHAAHRPGAEDRGSCHQERRGARRHRRDRRDCGTACAAQRDLCRDRRRLAAASDRPRSDAAGKKA